jgi:hypothetical protein
MSVRAAFTTAALRQPGLVALRDRLRSRRPAASGRIRSGRRAVAARLMTVQASGTAPSSGTLLVKFQLSLFR